MPTHHLGPIGRVEFSLLDYVNLALAIGPVAGLLWYDRPVLAAVFGLFAALIIWFTLYGARVMGRIEERKDADEAC